jgi:polysaccharide pyruvyl transferase WcaK-like protein
MKKREKKKTEIALFGNFDTTNFGNDCTLKAILYHLRRLRPDAEVTCICPWPKAVAAAHHIHAIPINEDFLKFFVPRSPLAKALRKIFIGLPSEPIRWVRAFLSLRKAEMLIIPGTGLLTDAYGLLGWGPFSLFRWSLIAKICRCKLAFVSIGVGPIDRTFGRFFAKSALALADFRSYRDISGKQCLLDLGFAADGDPVYPDLAFSLPETPIPQHDGRESNNRPGVGLGVMAASGAYNVLKPSNSYTLYLDKLVTLGEWLLARDYDIRLLSGDVADEQAWQEFDNRLKERERSSNYDDARIIRQTIGSVDDLLSQIVAADIIVATRFHNVLLALFCNKPVISLSFHHKCESLMSAVGLSEYCLDIKDCDAEMLIEKLRALEKNADKIKPLIEKKVRGFREALDEQYRCIFNLV